MSGPTASGFRAPGWLRGAHAQTIYASQWCPRPTIAYRRERWDTPDGDFIDVDLLAEPDALGDRIDEEGESVPGATLDHDPRRTPWLVVFHGLEGSSRSPYARTLMRFAQLQGWHGVVPHFRGCSGEPNRLARAYHSGDTAEVEWLLRGLARRAAGAPLYAVGVSLGGNALLKWLGERGSAAAEVVDAAVGVCAPLDLCAAGAALERGLARVYGWNFLRTLKPKASAKLARFPGLFDHDRLRDATTMRHFDDVYTAPVHGYRDVGDYWSRASSKPGLAAIAVPTLLINALDDPFLPSSVLPRADQVSSRVTLDYPRHGGHVGFVEGRFPGDPNWITRRIADFLGATPAQTGGVD
ncbi:MAG: hydrolase [Proteobacteria bacterium]|nr:hydrolase [Burkholderiales bacterium]